MTIWKFILKERVELAPGLTAWGQLAVVAAETEEQARAILVLDPDVDVRWIPHARVQKIDVNTPMLIALSQ